MPPGQTALTLTPCAASSQAQVRVMEMMAPFVASYWPRSLRPISPWTEENIDDAGARRSPELRQGRLAAVRGAQQVDADDSSATTPSEASANGPYSRTPALLTSVVSPPNASAVSATARVASVSSDTSAATGWISASGASSLIAASASRSAPGSRSTIATRAPSVQNTPAVAVPIHARATRNHRGLALHAIRHSFVVLRRPNRSVLQPSTSHFNPRRETARLMREQRAAGRAPLIRPDKRPTKTFVAPEAEPVRRLARSIDP